MRAFQSNRVERTISIHNPKLNDFMCFKMAAACNEVTGGKRTSGKQIRRPKAGTRACFLSVFAEKLGLFGNHFDSVSIV